MSAYPSKSLSDNRKSAIQSRKWAGFFAILVLLVGSGVVAEAQHAARTPRVGVLRSGSPPDANLDAFRQNLQEIGYVEGQNIVIDIRWAELKPDRLPELARELVRLNADVIVTSGPPATRAAQQATRTIPIVMAAMDDADEQGFVASLARPGGNTTGLSFQSAELSGKWLELLTEAVPKISRVAVLWDPSGTAGQVKTAEAAACSLKIPTKVVELRAPQGFDSAFEDAKRYGAGGVVILAAPLLTLQSKRLAQLALKNHLPAVYYSRNFTEAGGLLSYGPQLPTMFRRSAVFVDKILKGAKPADLPIEQPTKFDFIINLKTAKQIGLTIPPNVLARADRVIR